MIKSIVFDLDDTLYPEMDYVNSGFSVVANDAKKRFGIENGEKVLISLFNENSACVFNRFASANGLNDDVANSFIELYRNHIPNIRISDENKNLLTELREKGYKLGIITDGRPQGQRNKILALGLNNLVDKIIITDELGGSEYRKPNPKAFEIMCDEFRIQPNEMVYVGDNPNKDFAVKKILPITTVWLTSGNFGLYNEAQFLYGILNDITIHSLKELKNIITRS